MIDPRIPLNLGEEVDQLRDQLAASQQREAELQAEIAELVTALATLVRLSPPEVECENMHHIKADQHTYDETCPVVTRYAEARSSAQELVAKVRKQT